MEFYEFYHNILLFDTADFFGFCKTALARDTLLEKRAFQVHSSGNFRKLWRPCLERRDYLFSVHGFPFHPSPFVNNCTSAVL